VVSAKWREITAQEQKLFEQLRVLRRNGR
jgi:hypothetical protein